MKNSKNSKQISRRAKSLLIVLAIIILGGLYFYFVDKPVRDMADRHAVETSELQTEIDIYTAQAAHKEQMVKELEVLLADEDAAIIPDYDNLQQVISFLNTVTLKAADYKLSFPGIDMPAANDSGNIARRYLQMSFVASGYGQARKMIDELQDSPYCSQINAIDIIPVDEEGRTMQEETALISSRVKVTLSMVFYEKSM